MVRGCRMLLAGLVVLGMTSTLLAKDDWSLSKLVPFKKSTGSTKTRASVSDAGHNTAFPKMSLPSWNKKKGTPTKSSGWNNFTRGTKNLVNKTKNALTPGSKKPHHRTPKKKPAASWYKPWTWVSRSDESRIDSVDKFLPLPRPGV